MSPVGYSRINLTHVSQPEYEWTKVTTVARVSPVYGTGAGDKSDDELLEGFVLAFGLNLRSVDFIGLWPHKDDPAGQKYLRYIRVPMLAVILLVEGIAPCLYALVRTIHISLPLVIDNLSVTFNYTSSTCKILLLWYKREALKRVLRDVVRDWSTPKTPLELWTMKKQARWSRRCTITGYLLMFSCVFSYSISGLFNQSLRIINNVTDPGWESERYMPLQTYYPYDVSVSPYFELTYVVQCCTIAVCGIGLAVPDNLFGALVFHATGQCEILTSEMSHLIDGMESDDDGKRDEVFKLRIRRVVRKHMQLIRSFEDVKNIYSNIILTQVTCFLLIACCWGYGTLMSYSDVVGNNTVVQTTILAQVTMMSMFHMFVYCVSSEKLANQSMEIAHAIYGSRWYSIPTKYRRDLSLIILRSQSPLQHSVAGMVDLNLNTYLTILRTSWGYLSMLFAVS